MEQEKKQLENSISVGNRLKEVRLRHSMTQKECAALGGVSNASQGLYESGERSPNTQYLSYLYKGGFDVNYIVTGYLSVNNDIEVKLLTEIFEAISVWEEARSNPVSSQTKAELASLFYMQFKDSDKIDKNIITRHLRLVK